MSAERHYKFKRSSKACTTCRQMKLKCDAVARFPKPCSRCQKAASLCEIDTGFERERRRAKGGNASSAQGTVPQRSASPGLDTADKGQSVLWPNYGEVTAVIPPEKVLADIVILGDTIVPGEKVKLMFNCFRLYFYHHLPIFTEDLMDPEVLQRDHQLLFWAICAVTASHCCPEISPLVCQHAKQLVASTKETRFMANPLQSLTRCMALLILCCWQIHYESLQEDETWPHCGRALYVAMQMGLHRSSFFQEYSLCSNAVEQQTAIGTYCWAACFVVNQSVALFGGYPCPMAFSHNLFGKMTHLAKGNTQMLEFVKQVRILHVYHNGVQILGNNPNTEYGLSDPDTRSLLHRSVETQLSELAGDMAPLSNITELYCLCAKLHFHSFLLISDTLPADQRAITIPVYLVCVRIIDTVQQMASSAPLDAVRTWPSFVMHLCVSASVILFGVMVSEYGHLIDRDVARNKISDVYRILSSVANRENDRAFRSMRFIDGLQIMHSRKLLNPPLFTVRSRLGASAFWSLFMHFKRFQLLLKTTTDNAAAGDNQVQVASSTVIQDLEPGVQSDDSTTEEATSIDQYADQQMNAFDEWGAWPSFDMTFNS